MTAYHAVDYLLRNLIACSSSEAIFEFGFFVIDYVIVILGLLRSHLLCMCVPDSFYSDAAYDEMTSVWAYLRDRDLHNWGTLKKKRIGDDCPFVSLRKLT